MRQKKVWARWRYGNATKEGEKSFKDNCKACRNKAEALQHVIECEEIMKKLKIPRKEWWRSLREKSRQRDWRKELVTELQKEVDEELCSNLGKIKEILRVKD